MGESDANGEMRTFEWHLDAILREKKKGEEAKLAFVMLNQPIANMAAIRALWQRCKYLIQSSSLIILPTLTTEILTVHSVSKSSRGRRRKQAIRNLTSHKAPKRLRKSPSPPLTPRTTL